MRGSLQIRYRAIAADDVEQAVARYAHESGPHLADRFIDALRDVQARILAFPDAGSPRFAYLVRPLDIRVVPIAGFAYLVFYLARADVIDIVRVVHSTRDIPKHLGQ